MLEELGLSNVYLLAVTAGCGSGHSAKHDRQNWLRRQRLPSIQYQHEAVAEVGYLQERLVVVNHG